MQTPIERLREWMQGQGHTQATFSTASGFSDALVSMWLSGHRRPSLASAVRLEALTGGSIPVAAWLSQPPTPGRRSKTKRTPLSTKRQAHKRGRAA
jgi:transcriptional regulator with XRE-family HTH domain